MRLKALHNKSVLVLLHSSTLVHQAIAHNTGMYVHVIDKGRTPTLGQPVPQFGSLLRLIVMGPALGPSFNFLRD